MCGIQPTVLGLAALRAMGANHGSRLAAATSADAGGGTHRTVGYLSAAFTAEPPVRDD
jgi:AmmeMemoRadiSam system protein B